MNTQQSKPARLAMKVFHLKSHKLYFEFINKHYTSFFLKSKLGLTQLCMLRRVSVICVY